MKCSWLSEGLLRKKALWRAAGRAELESIGLARWAGRRRQDLLDLLDQVTPKIQELTHALEAEVEKRPVTRRLMTHPGGGPLTALAFELVIGTPERFHCNKQVAITKGKGLTVPEFCLPLARWHSSGCPATSNSLFSASTNEFADCRARAGRSVLLIFFGCGRLPLVAFIRSASSSTSILTLHKSSSQKRVQPRGDGLST